MHLFMVMGLLVVVALVVAVVIAVVVLAVHASTRTAYPTGPAPTQTGAATAPPARETPLEILARRFASGEVTADEYQRARALLEGGAKP
jgi:uncharacterized membrane protein